MFSTDIKSRLSILVFFSRWLQLPTYLGLIIAQAIYGWSFLKQLYELVVHHAFLNETTIMLSILGLIDMVMIANLLLMVTIGGYETFVSRLRIEGHPDQPEWLSHVNASVLKVKLSMAIVSISSIHLLQTFINLKQLPRNEVMWALLLHTGFVGSALVIALIDRILYPKSSTH